MSVLCRIRRGFTLVELLVVMAIISILMSLIMPAVQSARETARRTQCQNNLRQFGVALHNYHGSYNMFPPGLCTSDRYPGDPSAWSWSVMILPELEQTSLFGALEPNGPLSLTEALSQPATASALQQVLPIFLCPTDTAEERNFDRMLADSYGTRIDVGTSHYVGSFGVEPTYPGDGIFSVNSSVKMRDVTDGTSNTILIGERASADVALTGRHGAAVWGGATSDVSQNTLPDDGPSCALGSSLLMMGTGIHPAQPGSAKPWIGFSSMHPGGSQFALADGSVRFVNQYVESRVGPNISDVNQWGIYQKLGRIDDGHPVGEF